MNAQNIKKLFSPRSVAIIGASRSTKKVGGIILNNLLKAKFSGKIYAINPNTTSVQKHTTYDSVAELPEIVDVAVIAIPSAYVQEAVEECAQKGVKNIIIISAGFMESGGDGPKRELELRKIVEKYKLNLLGPNCLGIINARNNLNLSFANSPKRYSKGKISMISQSGAIGTAFLDWTQSNNIEISKFISLGNKAGLSENEFIEYFRDDKETEIILLYIENFSDGRRFYELAKSITPEKPIVVLKPGKSEDTQKAMEAHTGSLASSDKIIERALEDSGCIRVEAIEELFNITKLLDWQPVPKGNNVTIITNAGGVGIDTIDQLSQNGLDVKALPDKVQAELAKHLKPEASTHNPIDLLGDALAQDYKLALKKIVKDKSIDSIFVLLTPQLMTESLLTAKYVNEIADKSKKLVMASFLGGDKVKIAKAFLTKEKLPHYEFTNDAASVLGKIWKWQKSIKTISKPKLYYPSILNSSLIAKKGEMLDEKTTLSLLKKFGISYIESKIYINSKEVRDSKNIHFPVVLKLVAPALVHKTEFNAVRLPIYTQTELNRHLRDLDDIARKNDLKDTSFEIQPFIFNKIELILGISKDKASAIQVGKTEMLLSKGFGHTILVGTGGIYTEVIDDTALKLLPIDRTAALDMLKTVKVGKILFGERKRHFNYKAVLSLMVNLSKMIEKNSNITSLDINPVFVTEHDAYAVDVKIFVD